MTEPNNDDAGSRSRHAPWLWVFGGGIYGIALRVIFGIMPDTFRSPMSTAFLIGTPFVIGALTVYGIRKEPHSVVAWIFRPWVSVGLMLAGCAVTLLEGAICLAIISPLLLIISSVGGVVMGIVLDIVKVRSKHIGAFATLPLVLLALQPSEHLVDSTQEIHREILIAAPPERVWKEIVEARNIRPEELPLSLVHLIGVPRPVEGINEQTAQGEVRYSRWERGVRFQGIVTRRKEPESITWRYAFDQHSFPPGSMDEHVAIGGKYFDILDTTFNLHRLADNGTKLEIVAHYRVSTEINAYAVPLANILGNDFVTTLLGLYKGRSESNRS